MVPSSFKRDAWGCAHPLFFTIYNAQNSTWHLVDPQEMSFLIGDFSFPILAVQMDRNLEEQFSVWGYFPPGGHLATSKDIWGCHKQRDAATGIQSVPRMLPRMLQSTGQPPQERFIWAQMMPRCRSLGLDEATPSSCCPGFIHVGVWLVLRKLRDGF